MTGPTTDRTRAPRLASAPRPDGPRGRFVRRFRARAAASLRGFWYRFLRLFGLDSCPIDDGPGAGRPPGARGD